ncbi:MAG: hypothetical protein PW845_26680 [Pseudomonas sp.]|nr:hypothetical protein [Pseudomonas sp.]
MEEGTAPLKGYNFIYRKLVGNDDDLLGIVAYSTYKKQKVEYISSIWAEHGREPTQQELDAFHNLTNSPTQIENYHNQAITMMRSFTDAVIDEKVREVSVYYQDKAREEIARFKPKFWFGVCQSVVGSAAFVLLLGVLVIFTWSLNQGPIQIIENIFDIHITSR